MRISDWSSDVCSSDLSQAASSAARPDAAETALSIFEACERRGIVDRQDAFEMRGILLAGRRFEQARRFTASHPDAGLSALPAFSSEARRFGKECVSPCRSRWPPYTSKKNQ